MEENSAPEVEQQRNVSVFSSDDDLTNFLAGLRAKYASLYPQYAEPEGDVHADGRTDDNNSAALSVTAGGAVVGTQPVPAGDDASADAVVSAPASFEQKISQLRSSLQSLQHLLPPRTTTTANLLDSFIAVSGDDGSQAAGLTHVAKFSTFGEVTSTDAASALSRASAPGPLRVGDAARDAGSFGDDVGASSSDTSLQPQPWRDGLAITAAGADCEGAPFMAYGDTAAAGENGPDNRGAAALPVAAAPVHGDGDDAREEQFSVAALHAAGDAASDAAFTELAAAYSCCDLQSPSSPASCSSPAVGNAAGAQPYPAGQSAMDTGALPGLQQNAHGDWVAAVAKAGDLELECAQSPGEEQQPEVSQLGPLAAPAAEGSDELPYYGGHGPAGAFPEDMTGLSAQQPAASSNDRDTVRHSLEGTGAAWGPNAHSSSPGPVTGLQGSECQTGLLANPRPSEDSGCTSSSASAAGAGRVATATRESSAAWESVDDVSPPAEDCQVGQAAAVSYGLWSGPGPGAVDGSNGGSSSEDLPAAVHQGPEQAAEAVAQEAASAWEYPPQAEQMALLSDGFNGGAWFSGGPTPVPGADHYDGPDPDPMQSGFRPVADVSPQLQHSYASQALPEQPSHPLQQQLVADASSPSAARAQQRPRRRWGSPLHGPGVVGGREAVASPTLAEERPGRLSDFEYGVATEELHSDQFEAAPPRPDSPRSTQHLGSGGLFDTAHVSGDAGLSGLAPGQGRWTGGSVYASTDDDDELLQGPEVPLETSPEVPSASAAVPGSIHTRLGRSLVGAANSGDVLHVQQEQHRAAWNRPLRLRPPPPSVLRHGAQASSQPGPWAGEQATAASPAATDEVVCGSPTDLAASTAADADAGPTTGLGARATDALGGEGYLPEAEATLAGSALPHTGNTLPLSGGSATAAETQAGPGATSSSGVSFSETLNSTLNPLGAAGANGIVANKGGVAFSISLGAPAQSTLPAPEPALKALIGHPSAAAAALVPLHDPGLLTAAAAAGPLDWQGLDRQLREAGFGALLLAADPINSSQQHGPSPSPLLPETASLHRCLSSVLEQYVRRNRLVAELLAATEQSGRVAQQQEVAMRELQREVNAARAAAERARRELADVSSQQLPKVEAKHATQVSRLRSEVAKLKEALRAAELDAGSKAEEIRSLKATVTGLQSASSHNSDVEGAALRQRVAQLEGLLRVRDKEVEKLKATKETLVGQAEGGQANALDRAYEAEGAARRLDTELTAARTRVGQLEQALRQRERDVAAMREDLQQIKACEAAAAAVAQERRVAAEEGARRAEGEAAVLRGSVRELEAVVRAARQEMEKQRLEGEALRSTACEEVHRLEDECRGLRADLAASRRSAGQLEHVVRAKEREVVRAREEKEAAKAAERERSRVAEEVSVKLETELTAAKVRLAQTEGALRTRERELGRLAELLRQTQGAEVEAWLKQAKTEDGSRKLESDFTSLRLRVLQLEAALKGRDKECDKLGRVVEALRGETHELTSKLVKSEEACRKSEADLSASRGKVLSLEGHLRVKDREAERLVRVLERMKAGDAEVASRQAALEEAARRLDGQLLASKSRAAALEGVVRARDAAVERLNRQLEALKTAEFERTAQAAKSEEAGRQQDAEAVALRQRVVQLEGQLRTKDREMERGARAMDAVRAAEADVARRLLDAGAAISRLEAEVAAGRQHAAQLGEALRGREREVAALSRALDVQRAAEHDAAATAGRTGEEARRLDGQAAELRQRLVQTEGQLRTREREAERQARALEAAQTVSAQAASRLAEAEAAVRRLEADTAGLRQRLAQAEGAVRARERELERYEKQAEQAKCAESQAEVRQRTAEAAVVQVDGELSTLRARIAQLESAARGHTKEVERLTRVMDQSKAAEMDAALRAQRSDEAARQVAAELSSARTRVSRVEASLAAREQEAQRLQQLLAAAEAQAATQASRSDEFVRRVEGDLASMRQRATQLAQLIRSRDRQITTLRGALEAKEAGEAQTSSQWRQGEEAMRKLERDLAAERQRAAQLDGLVKSRERELERLGRQLDAGRDQTTSAAVAADRQAAALKDAAGRTEAALATAKARITELESELVSKERQLEAAQRLAGYSRAGDAEAATAAEERAGGVVAAARRVDGELAAVRMRCAQLEHALRSREATLDKLRAALTEKVAREERRLARDKAAYSRIRAAYVASMGPAAGGDTPGGGGQHQRAAGAMAAAARELRPLEIVGLYETQREAVAAELATCRAEVRSLAEQLRDAQNLIALKDRSGAWRTPQELADMQARIIVLERRGADQQRELDRARLEAAEAGRAAERRLAEAEHRAAQLKADSEALVQELDGRPTLQDHRTLKREVEILEKRLLQAKGSAAVNGAGAEAEGGETALRLALARKGREGGSMLTTAQRMARDRSLHRLGLRALEDWPKDVMVDLVQDVCIELDLSDATTLPAAVRKALRVLAAVPRMEAFIGSVCDSVYRKGAAFVPHHIDGTTDPNRVLEVLSVWLGRLQEGAQLRATMRGISEALAARAEGMAMPIHGPADVLTSVRQLVEAEAAALTARESLAAAANHLVAQPEEVLSRVVTHFMRLFDVPSLEGVVPSVNRLYVALNEQCNFVRALTAALGLPKDAGASACMTKIHELVEGAATAAEPAGCRPEQLARDQLPKHGDAVSAHPAAPAAQVVGVESSEALGKLMALFNVKTVAAVADAAEKHVARLRRLDELLPRYQRLAANLFETLRCTSLEEVMPALMAALQRQHSH